MTESSITVAKASRKGVRRGAASPTSPRNVDAEERQRKAWELRLGGATLAMIAANLGIGGTNPEARARELVLAYRDKTRAADAVRATEERDLQADRIDRMLLDLWTARIKVTAELDDKGAPAVDAEGKPKVTRELDLPTFDRIVRVMERQAKLLGLDAGDMAEDARMSLLREQAETIARALDAALMELGLDEETRQRGRVFVARRLRAIEGEAVRVSERAS